MDQNGYYEHMAWRQLFPNQGCTVLLADQLIEPLRVSVEWVGIPIVGEAHAYQLRLVVDT